MREDEVKEVRDELFRAFMIMRWKCWKSLSISSSSLFAALFSVVMSSLFFRSKRCRFRRIRAEMDFVTDIDRKTVSQGAATEEVR